MTNGCQLMLNYYSRQQARVVRSACPPPPAGECRPVRVSAAARRPMSFGPPVRRRPPAHFVSVRSSAAARRPPARACRSCCMQHKQASNKRQSAVYSMCNTRLRQACRIPAEKRHAMQNILHHMNHMYIAPARIVRSARPPPVGAIARHTFMFVAKYSELCSYSVTTLNMFTTQLLEKRRPQG